MGIKVKIMNKLFWIAFCLASFIARIEANEGHPIWWWDIKGKDLVVQGKLSFDSNNYLQIIPKNDEKIGKDHYYIYGKLLLEDILYANSQNQFRDNYNYYFRNIGKQIDVLIPARRVFWDHMKPDDIKIEPSPNNEGVELARTAKIFTMDVVYMFPIGGLIVSSAVPREEEPVVRKLIAERANNLAHKKREKNKPNNRIQRTVARARR